MAKYNLGWIAALAMLSLTMLTACSSEELDVNPQSIVDTYSDLYKRELYGKVKTITRSEFSGSSWKNGAIVKGDITQQYIYQFNAAGYVTRETQKKLARTIATSLISDYETVITYDAKNRPTEKITLTFHRSSSIDSDEILYTVYQKQVITYDDHAKTATITVSEYNDKSESEYKPVKKWIYALNKDGKLDENNYEAGVITQASFDGNSYDKLVTTYDSKGNIAKQYKQKVENGEVTEISAYVEVAYEYYQ